MLAGELRIPRPKLVSPASTGAITPMCTVGVGFKLTDVLTESLHPTVRRAMERSRLENFLARAPITILDRLLTPWYVRRDLQFDGGAQPAADDLEKAAVLADAFAHGLKSVVARILLVRLKPVTVVVNAD